MLRLSEKQRETRLSAVLDLIYQVPVAETGWDIALTAACDFIGAEAADLNFFNPASLSYARWEPGRIDSETTRRYLADYMSDVKNVHPRMPVVRRLKEGELIADSDLWTPRERSGMPYFADIALPIGWRDCLFTNLRRGDSGQSWIVLGTYFGKKCGIPQQDIRDRLRMLLPHLRRSSIAEEKLQQARREKAVLVEALDCISEAVAMVDCSGKVMRANRAAEAILNAANGVSLARDGRIILSTADAKAALARGLAQCASPIVWVPSAAIGPPAQIAVRRGNGDYLVLTLQPLPKELAGTYGAVALLYIADPYAKSKVVESSLHSTFGFTPREAELAQALLNGTRLEEYARDRGVSINTARSQLQTLFSKTGTTRQAELLRLLEGFRQRSRPN